MRKKIMQKKQMEEDQPKTIPKNPFVCPKKGIGPPTFLFFSDGIGTLNPIRSGGVWILRE